VSTTPESLDRELLPALDLERRENARRLSGLRLAGVTLFTALFLVLGPVLHASGWSSHVELFAPYWVLSLAVYVAARRFDGVARSAGLAVAALDMPAVFFIQRAGFKESSSPIAVAGYSIGFFVFFVLLSSLSLSRWKIGVVSLAGASFEALLQHLAGVSPGAEVATFLLLGVTGATCSYGSERMALLVGRVVGEQRALQETLQKLRDAQEAMARAAKLAAVGQLSASISHDLRNPLSAVNNALFVIDRRLRKQNIEDATISQMVAVAQREVERSNTIIGELLDFTRERPLEPEATPIAALVQEVLEVVRGRENVAVSTELGEPLPAPLLDRGLMRQVLVNLVQNAIEAIPADRAGTVRLCACALPDGGIGFQVIDDGAGIPEALRSKIFEPLVTTKRTGTGLGLAICQSAVRRHGGELTLESELGKGTTFRVTLPAVPAPRP
jgi:signal transduction histidine kinase